ncbi:MAG: MBL fold metallo-hydrolase, partial [Saprospiraceae bacterium]|nr:MBL fold metallo-hydrolase [Saprospiraceae bacterium]
ILEHRDDVPCSIYTSNHISVATIPLDHRLPTTGYLFREVRPKRRIRAAMIDKYQIPYKEIAAIQDGAPFISKGGVTIPNIELTIDAPSPSSYAYCSDTAYCPDIIEQIKQVQILYHESTFLSDLTDEAVRRKHSTAAQAAQIARKASVKKLLLGHFSSRYKDLVPFLTEAQEIFKNAHVCVDGQQFSFKELES